MGLSSIKEIPASLFDQLLALNDLVQTVRDTENLNEIVNALQNERDANKKQADDLLAVKIANEATIKQLQGVTAANLQSIADLDRVRTESSQAQEAAESSTQKSQTLLRQLTQVQDDYARQVKDREGALSQRAADLEAKEKAAVSAQSEADNLVAEYTKKLDALKSITGG